MGGISLGDPAWRYVANAPPARGAPSLDPPEACQGKGQALPRGPPPDAAPIEGVLLSGLRLALDRRRQSPHLLPRIYISALTSISLPKHQI
jgi:hypothetical protein